MTAFTIDLKSVVHITNEQFYQLCRANPDVKFERSAIGELIVMSPTGGETGSYNSEINAEFVFWNRQTRLGKVFDSSTCFQLPQGGDIAPQPCGIDLLMLPGLRSIAGIGLAPNSSADFHRSLPILSWSCFRQATV